MYEDVCYNNNFVKEVLVRIDFSNIISDFLTHMPKDIGMIIKKYFPIVEPQDVIGTDLQMNGVGQQLLLNSAGQPIITKQWVFNSRDRKNQCIILPNNILFKYNAYNIYEDLKEVVKEIVQSINKAYTNIDAKRLGMRYVNIIPLNGDNDLIVEEYIKPLNNFRSANLVRGVTVVEYSLEQSEINVRHQYGFMNKDYPAIMNTDDFTIDIDAYATGLLYLDDTDELIDKMHVEIQRVFETSITDKLRGIIK